MAGIQLSGLASGLDWRSLVDQLSSVERVPITALQSEKTSNTQKTSAMDSLTSALTALQTAMKALSSDNTDIFSDRTAKIGGSTTWNATASSGTPTGTYEVNVLKLATRSTLGGSARPGAPLSATSDVSGVSIATASVGVAIRAGEFTVNGSKVAVSTTDSLQDVFDRIGAATGGAVNASYDPATDKVRLSSASEIVLGASNDTSNFLSAFSLFNSGGPEILSPKALGTVSLSTAIANANLKDAISNTDAEGNGKFSINGVEINFNKDTDSISTVMNRINTSSAGVTASFDKLNDRFVLTNKTTGDLGLSISEEPGGFLAALGVNNGANLTRGNSAQVSINNGPTLTSQSNTFDESVTGISGLAVTATSEGAQSVTVSGDSSGARSKVDEFIKQYNAVQSYIEQTTKTTVGTGGKLTTSIFSSNREVSDIAKSLRNKILGEVPGLTGTIKRLESIGIDFQSGTNNLQVKDSAALDSALLNRGDDLKTLFGAKPDGLVARIDSYVSKITGSTGSLTTQKESLAKQNTRIDEQIAAMERRLDAQKSLLEASFIHMEEMQSTINTQLAALNNAFGSSSSSSSKK